MLELKIKQKTTFRASGQHVLAINSMFTSRDKLHFVTSRISLCSIFNNNNNNNIVIVVVKNKIVIIFKEVIQY